MRVLWRKHLTGIGLLLAAGVLVGWLYGRPDLGLLAAALAVLIWQTRQVLLVERAISRRKFDNLQLGGVWSRIVSRARQLNERGRRHKKRYRHLLKDVRNSTNAMPDGGIVLNGSSEIVLCNAAARDLVGFRPRQDRGQRVDNLLRDPSFVRYLNSGNFDDGVEIRSPVRDGDWLFCRLIPYGADQRLLLIRDVTQAKRLKKLRRDFVANASHELRSPLTVISGYIDTLAGEEDVPEHWQKPLGQMQAAASRMNTIVAELLELSRLEGGGTAPAAQAVDLPGLLAAARKACADREDVPEIIVECETNARILGSNAEIESVISNLLSNAVRHTPGSGTVTLRWELAGDHGLLSVADTGEGIEDEHLPRLTERFFRVDPGRSRGDGGIGLGLAIVKHALSRHDAVLEIESTPGRGSRFTCRFPPSRLTTESDPTLARESAAG